MHSIGSGRPFLKIAVVLSATALTLSPALAYHWHHAGNPHHYAHRSGHALAGYVRATPPAYASPYPYWGGWQAAVIARAAIAQQNAPGVTNELAPDNIATATGGPSGGVPGFSGH